MDFSYGYTETTRFTLMCVEICCSFAKRCGINMLSHCDNEHDLVLFLFESNFFQDVWTGELCSIICITSIVAVLFVCFNKNRVVINFVLIRLWETMQVFHLPPRQEVRKWGCIWRRSLYSLLICALPFDAAQLSSCVAGINWPHLNVLKLSHNTTCCQSTNCQTKMTFRRAMTRKISVLFCD